MCKHRDMRVFHDAYGNTAILQPVRVFPYYGTTVRKASYRLIIKSDYDAGFVNFVSVYETEQEALNQLKTFSCGSFREKIPSDKSAEFYKLLFKKLGENFGLR